MSIGQSIAETALELLWNCSKITKLPQQDIARWGHTWHRRVSLILFCSSQFFTKNVFFFYLTRKFWPIFDQKDREVTFILFFDLTKNFDFFLPYPRILTKFWSPKTVALVITISIAFYFISWFFLWDYNESIMIFMTIFYVITFYEINILLFNEITMNQ